MESGTAGAAHHPAASGSGSPPGVPTAQSRTRDARQPELPTAAHAVADVQEIALSCASPGSGIVTVIHVDPLRLSARRWVPPLSWKLPTAMHLSGEVQATPFSTEVAPGGRATPCCSQLPASAGCATMTAAATTSPATRAGRLTVITPVHSLAEPSPQQGSLASATETVLKRR